MIVLYDHQIFSIQKFGGISRYYSVLINSKKINAKNSILISKNAYYKRLKFFGFFPSRVIFFINNLYTRFIMSYLKYNIYHPTYYYGKSNCKGKLVITVYDMIHERINEKFSVQDLIIQQKKDLIFKADKIIAISEYTKNEILYFYKISPKKIDVIYLATDFNVKAHYNPCNIEFSKYILFVGNRDGYKNSAIIFEIAKQLSYYDIHVIFMGSNPFNDNELAYLKSNNLESLVHYQSASSNQVMQDFYFNSICFVFPSKDEGFGIPILEAFASKTPVVLSDIIPFREIALDSALFFDPTDINQLMGIILMLNKSKFLREKYIEAGLNRLKDFSWEQTIDKTFSLYEDVLKGAN